MRIRFCFLFWLMVAASWAQVTLPSEEEVARKKEINSIKLNGEAIYADVYQEATTEEAALSEAELRSKQMLQTHVIEIFSKRLNMSKKDVQEIWKVLESRCQNIVVKRGDLFRVFTYVMKNALGAGGEAESAEELAMAEVTETVSQEAQPVQEVAVVQKDTSTVVAAAPVQQPVVVPPAQPVQATVVPPGQPTSPVQSPPAQPVQPVQPVQVAAAPPVQAVQTSPVQAPPVQPVQPSPAPVVVQPAPAVEVVVPALCQTMISKGNMNELMRYLSQEKRYQRLMFGNSSSMQYPDKCYVVIIDKSTLKIVSLLDKGESERMNFITKQMDRYSNYRGGNYAAIFVQEYQ